MKQKIFCLVLNYQNHSDTEKCLNALLASDIPTGTELFIIDNSPTRRSAKYLFSRFPKIKLIRNAHNLGFAGGNNIGVKLALDHNASHVLIINPDVTVGDQFFSPLIKDLDQNPQLGLVAPAIKHHQGRQLLFGLEGHLDRLLLKATHTNLAKLPKKTKLLFGDFVTFACVLIKSEVFRDVGLLDERYFMYLEDVDYCLMAKQKGFKSAVDPGVVVEHVTSSSFKKPTDKLKISFVSQMKFITKWQKFPLSLISYVYGLAFYPYLYLLWTIHFYRDFFRPKT